MSDSEDQLIQEDLEGDQPAQDEEPEDDQEEDDAEVAEEQEPSPPGFAPLPLKKPPQVPKPPAPVVPLMEVSQCPFAITRGARKGEVCHDKAVAPGGYCMRHRNTVEAKDYAAGRLPKTFVKAKVVPAPKPEPLDEDTMTQPPKRKVKMIVKGKLKDTLRSWSDADPEQEASVDAGELFGLMAEMEAARAAARARGPPTKSSFKPPPPEDDDEEEPAPEPKKPAPKKEAKKKMLPVPEVEEEEEPAPKPKKAAPKQAAKKPAPKKEEPKPSAPKYDPLDLLLRGRR